MRKFDYSFLKNGRVPANLVNITNSIHISRFASEEKKEKYKYIFTELEKIAKVQSVKGSNAIEGIVTTDKRIQEIVNRNSAPQNHSESEIAGYRDCLNRIHIDYKNIQFDEDTILSLHKQLLNTAGYSYGGVYKKEDNVILEIDMFGNRKVRFYPVPASETKESMEQLVLAYKEASRDASINPLLLIPCVILDFLCIHPFDDENGRMSRLLSLLLLYKAGFDVGKYISFEEQINIDKDLYYSDLQKSSIGWMENQNSYFYFVEYFLITLSKCYNELNSRFLVVNSNKITKKGRIEATIANSFLPINKKKICMMHPDISQTTVEAVLADLVKSGKIEKIGNTNGVLYRHK